MRRDRYAGYATAAFYAASVTTRDAEPSKLFVPKAFGWGYDINFARLLRRH